MGLLKLALSSLTGGGAGSLDKIDGNDLNDGDAAVVVISGYSYHYHLNATSGVAENAPYVISPDSNPGTKRWELVTPQGAFSHVRAESTAGQTGILDSTDTKLLWAVEHKDDLGEFSSSTFTATYTGKYLVTAKIITDSSITWATNDLIDIRTYIDGSADIVFGSMRFFASGAYATPIQGTTVVDLVAGETLDIYYKQASGSTGGILAVSDRNILTIDRIA